MQQTSHNIPGAPYYEPGKYIPGSNHILGDVNCSFNLPFEYWTSTNSLVLSNSNHFNFHHIHYIFNNTGIAPNLNELADAPYFSNTVTKVFVLGEGVHYLFLLGHNATHHGSDISTFGPFSIDMLPPIGWIKIAGGVNRIFDRNTYVEVSGVDVFSSVSGVYITGDLEDNGNINKWMPIDSYYDVVLASGDPGRRTVECRFMDMAGNQSNAVFDDIYFGATKYFFYKTSSLIPIMESTNPGKHINNDSNKFKQDMSPNMTTGEENGNFGANI